MKKIFLLPIILGLFSLPVFAYEINITSPYDNEVWYIDTCSYSGGYHNIIKPVTYTYDVPYPDECYYEVYNSTGLNFNISLPDCVQGTSYNWEDMKTMYFTWFTDNSTQHTLRLYMNDTEGNVYVDEVNFTPYKVPTGIGNLIFWTATKYGDTWYSKSLNTFWGVDYGICGARNYCNLYVNDVSFDNQYTHGCGGAVYLPYTENANNTIRFEGLIIEGDKYACNYLNRPLPYPHEQFCDIEPYRIYDNTTRTANIIIDTILPEAIIETPAGNYSNGTTEVNLNYVVNELYPKQCSYSINNGTPVNLNGMYGEICQNATITGLTNGSYELRLFIEDLAGNTNEIITYFVILSPTEPPEPPQTSGLAGLLFLVFGVVVVLIGLNYFTEVSSKESFIEFSVMILIAVICLLILATML